jgi:hypothetical protein
METNLEKSDWIIDLKGYFPETVKESFSGEYFTDLVYGTRTINFTGTKDELDSYIERITSKESQVKVIGILNKADTLVEFRRVFDVGSIPTSRITVSDLFNSRSWTFDTSVAEKLLLPEERPRFFETLKDNPTRRFIRRDYLEEFVLENLKNLEK